MGIIAWTVLCTAVAGVGGTGLGGVVGAILQRDSKKVVSLLLSFAGGIMLSVVCFDLVTSAIHPAGAQQDTNILFIVAGILVGYLMIYFLNLLIDHRTNHEVPHIDSHHPKTADDLDELIHSDHLEAHIQNHGSLFMAGVIMAFAIALHNLPEGMVIGASYANNGADNMFTGSGFLLTIIIGLHNIPEGMAVAVPLISGGMHRAKAILITALSGAPTIIGALLGYYVGTLSPMGLALSLCFASGAMLYVVFGELLPEAILMWKSKLPALAVMMGMLLGMLIIYL